MADETEQQRAALGRIRDELTALCRCHDPLLEPQFRFLLDRVEALLLVTET